MPCPGHFTPGKETQYPLYSTPGGPSGPSGQVRKISPLLELNPWTVQPVMSRYTDNAILAHSQLTFTNALYVQHTPST
jgi:hypothetical protein